MNYQVLYFSGEHLCGTVSGKEHLYGSLYGRVQLTWAVEAAKMPQDNVLPRPMVTETGSERL